MLEITGSLVCEERSGHGRYPGRKSSWLHSCQIYSCALTYGVKSQIIFLHHPALSIQVSLHLQIIPAFQSGSPTSLATSFPTAFRLTMSSTISSTSSVTTTSSASATCTTAVPGKYGHIPPEACNAIYSYYPSFGAAIVFALLFGGVTAFHIFQAAKFKKVISLLASSYVLSEALTSTQTFCWVIIMGCIWETASFGLRTVSTRHQDNTGLYTYSFLLVLLAPLRKFFRPQ